MKSLLKATLVAAALAGASLGLGATATPANAAVSFYVGPGGAQIGYSHGYWYDRAHRRHRYTYPNDWRTYRHERAWYRTHPYWYRDHDWYRR